MHDWNDVRKDAQSKVMMLLPTDTALYASFHIYPISIQILYRVFISLSFFKMCMIQQKILNRRILNAPWLVGWISYNAKLHDTKPKCN